MMSDFSFVRGEFLTKVNKFVYIQETKRRVENIDNLLHTLDPMTNHVFYNMLLKQRQRLEEKIVDLKKSIVEDISASKE